MLLKRATRSKHRIKENMQAVIVDHNPEFARVVAAHMKVVPRVHNKDYYENASPEVIVQEINELAAGDKDTIVLINVELNCRGGSSQQQMGVEVLKHLRLTKNFYDRKKSPALENNIRDVHCVMYSFFTLEQILRRKPENYIVCSQGTTFICLPSDFTKVPNLVHKKAKLDSLGPYIRSSLTLPDERHEWANWWGIRQLCEVHKHVVDNLKTPYPEKVQDELKKIRSKQAIHLFGYSDKELGAAHKLLSDRISGLRTTLDGRIPRILHIDDRWEDGWSKIFIRMIYPNASLNKQTTSSSELNSTYIDFFLANEPLFRVFKAFASDGTASELAEKRMDSICAGLDDAMRFNPNLVLLDLRLLNETGVRSDAVSLSGAKVLRWLRDRSYGIPVIMTTASNKVWSLEQLIQLGADAFWVKEGLDERKTPGESVRNYIRLLRLVTNMPFSAELIWSVLT
jgi:CheY-like chemotaxis protein